jgi:hypothetical protein
MRACTLSEAGSRQHAHNNKCCDLAGDDDRYALLFALGGANHYQYEFLSRISDPEFLQWKCLI